MQDMGRHQAPKELPYTELSALPPLARGHEGWLCLRGPGNLQLSPGLEQRSGGPSSVHLVRTEATTVPTPPHPTPTALSLSLRTLTCAGNKSCGYTPAAPPKMSPGQHRRS